MNTSVQLNGVTDLIHRVVSTLEQDLATLQAAGRRQTLTPTNQDLLDTLALRTKAFSVYTKTIDTSAPGAEWIAEAKRRILATSNVARVLGMPDLAALNADRYDRLDGLVADLQDGTGGSTFAVTVTVVAFGLAWWLFRPGGLATPKTKPFRELSPSPPRRHTIITTHEEEDAEYEPA